MPGRHCFPSGRGLLPGIALAGLTALGLTLLGTHTFGQSDVDPEVAATDWIYRGAVENGRPRLSQYFVPGEPIRPDEMRITVVGSGMPDVRRNQASASVLAELGSGEVLLFDVGTGSVMNLNALGIEGKVTKVFLTHLHTDHAGDLDTLWVSAITQRQEVLKVWGPSGLTPEYGTKAFIENFQKLWYWDKQSRTGILSSLGMAIEGEEFDYSKTQVVYEADGVKITSFPAIHTIDGPVSYRLDWNDLSFVFSGDTIPNRWLVEQARGVDLLIHESFPPPALYAEKTGYPLSTAKTIATVVHTSPAGVGKIFAMTEPRMAAVYHLFNNFDLVAASIDEIRKSYDGPLAMTEDLMVFNVTRDSIVVREALVADKVIGHRRKSIASEVDPADRIPTSQWLQDGALEIDDSETP